MIWQVQEVGRELAEPVPIVYAENHPMDLGRLLPDGTDISLNATEQTRDLFGANGMRAALNGMPCLRVLDG